MKNMLVIFSMFLIAPSLCQAGEVLLNIKNVRNERGQLIVAVFGQKEYAKKKNPVVINGKEVRFLLPARSQSVAIELPEGEYSIGIVHDENANSKMDRIPLGPPTEGGGFTGGMNFTGPKAWGQSKIVVPTGRLNVDVEIRYWL